MEAFVVLLVLLVIWGALGLLGASIMQNKGRSTGAGFALGALLGPLGLIVAMLMGPSADHLARRYVEHVRSVQTPRGLRAAKGIGWYCELCGTTFNDTSNAFESYEHHVCPSAVAVANAEATYDKESRSPGQAAYPGTTLAPFHDSQQSAAAPDSDRSDAEMTRRLIEQTGAVCAGCDREFDDSLYLQLDHNTPRSDGGLNHISNRLLLCGPCNRIKSNTLTLSGLRRENAKRGRMAAKGSG